MEYKSLSKLRYADPEHYKSIYEERFHANNAIHFDFQIHDNSAFVVVTPAICAKMLSICRKDKIVGKFDMMLPGKALEQFAQRCLIDEIMISNNIEGVHSSRKELREVLAEADKSGRNKRFKGLVQKYAMLQGQQKLRFQTCEDVRTLYDGLVASEIREDDPANLPDGQLFRKGSTSVLTATQKEIHRGITPESRIIAYMDSALGILNDDSLELLLRIAVFHYLFGYIHPFYDGNGRTSRFISSYLLSRNFEPILGYRLSYTIKENIKQYYDAFIICYNPHNLGEITPFVDMFLGIIDQSMTQLISALEKRYRLLQLYHGAIRLLPFGGDKKYETLYFCLIQASLFADADGGISLSDLADLMDVSTVTANKRLSDLGTDWLIVNKQGNTNLYQLNLEPLDKLMFDK